MRLYPAIDIKNGQCVRLTRGDFNAVDVYSTDPAKIAKSFEEQGAEFIHVVDLDAALAGYTVNEKVIGKIVESVSIPVQTGGGIRTPEDVAAKLGMGLARVIIGTKAVENPDFVKAMIEKYGPEKIVVGIDAKNGNVAVKGWEKVSAANAVEMAAEMKKIGVKTIVYTDIFKDGMLSGPNFEYTEKMVRETGIDIIASGGVSTVEDLEKLSKINVEGAIIGKAIYEKRIDLRVALERVKS